MIVGSITTDLICLDLCQFNNFPNFYTAFKPVKAGKKLVMADCTPSEYVREGPISPWWLRSVLIIMVIGFSVLGYITYKGYDNAPPIPGAVLSDRGETLYTKEDVIKGQGVFLKYGLMNNGTIWGHGAMLGPDFAAMALHSMGVDSAEELARQKHGQSFDDLDKAEKSSIEARVAALFKENRYDEDTDTLTLSRPASKAWRNQFGYWAEYFSHPGNNAGLKADLIADPEELEQFAAFVGWAAWASVAERPGTNHSYTNNFPYDPLVGNQPTSQTVLWSAAGLLGYLGALAIALMMSGSLKDIDWVSSGPVHPRIPLPGAATPGQRAMIKFFVVVAVLFLLQTLLGGAIAHYRIEPDGFYGLPLEKIFPSNLLRTWHMQVAVLWIATAYVGAALFLGTTLRKYLSPSLSKWVNFLFVAFAIVIFGSLLGEWLGIEDKLGWLWFWLGNQGWEYLEMGRIWQYLLAIGLVVWFVIVLTMSAPGRIARKEDQPLVNLFLVGALSIPVFYLPALFFGPETNYTIVDTWRFWIIHLWVEGFFEFFATAAVALTFYQLGLARRNVALKIVYFDAILYFGGGVLGTGHHWYFNGQDNFNMAIASFFSAIEVVPLTLLTLEAWGFVKTARAEEGTRESKELISRHKWTIYFLMAVGFWNFFGAGVFGFLINMPIVAYFETGTQLTANHGHAALMGVFGMLALAMMAFTLRQTATDKDWVGIENWVKWGFWGTNIGLAMMVLMSLFPSGVIQLWDVLENGYWHARSQAYTRSNLALLIEWLRFPGDMVFIVFGSVPMTVAAAKAWLAMRRRAD